jgi:hypothetical protein
LTEAQDSVPLHTAGRNRACTRGGDEDVTSIAPSSAIAPNAGGKKCARTISTISTLTTNTAPDDASTVCG